MAASREDVSTAIEPPEVIRVGARRVKCDGGGGALGHPVVFMDMGKGDRVECVYCDRQFVFDAALAVDGDHH